MIPENIIKILEAELSGLSHGTINLEIVLHDNKAKYRVIKTISIVPNRPTSGCEKNK